MKNKFRDFYSLTLFVSFIIFLPVFYGCASMAGSEGAVKVEQEEISPPPPDVQAAIEPETKIVVQEEPYDLESEMPEKDSLDEEETLVESIDPLKADSFSVEESTEPAAPSAMYDLGYRIQLAAFAESESARALKKNIMASTGMAVYIEYEEGLYKVRAGDFAARAEAVEARARLAESYPDCWIVRTTVLKAR